MKSDYSEQIAAKIDVQVRDIVSNCYAKVKELLQENRMTMDRLVEMLMVEETIDGDLFRNIVEENKFDKIPVIL